MTELTTEIGDYNSDTRSVPVTFTSGDIVHKRDVNAVLDDNDAYDAAATALRVAQVANGVAAKIGLGVIKAVVPEADADTEAEADTETDNTFDDPETPVEGV